ncbi:MAG TPA: hypothetical protein VHY91_05155 [Pirellulales bacterium]|jgi:hypothetical protein|nr:hypothetical protein [Pirellulales bacterium]
MDNRSIIKQWLRDSAIAFLLIMAGISAGRPLADWFQTRGSIGNFFCFAIAEIPFVCFLGMRRGFFRWWEYLGFLVCALSMTIARDRLVQLGLDNLFVVAVVEGILFGCSIALHDAIQGYLTASPPGGRVRLD